MPLNRPDYREIRGQNLGNAQPHGFARIRCDDRAAGQLVAFPGPAEPEAGWCCPDGLARVGLWYRHRREPSASLPAADSKAMRGYKIQVGVWGVFPHAKPSRVALPFKIAEALALCPPRAAGTRPATIEDAEMSESWPRCRLEAELSRLQSKALTETCLGLGIPRDVLSP